MKWTAQRTEQEGFAEPCDSAAAFPRLGSCLVESHCSCPGEASTKALFQANITARGGYSYARLVSKGTHTN